MPQVRNYDLLTDSQRVKSRDASASNKNKSWEEQDWRKKTFSACALSMWFTEWRSIGEGKIKSPNVWMFAEPAICVVSQNGSNYSEFSRMEVISTKNLIILRHISVDDVRQNAFQWSARYFPPLKLHSPKLFYPIIHPQTATHPIHRVWPHAVN